MFSWIQNNSNAPGRTPLTQDGEAIFNENFCDYVLNLTVIIPNVMYATR